MYKLPRLAYLYQDLEPFIDTHTMALHYHKHMQNYLNNLNDLLNKNYYDYRYSINELIYHIDEFNESDKENILFNLGGVLNHDLYFKSISKNNFKPTGLLRKKINDTYGSYDNLLDKLEEEALKLKGSGYTFLVCDTNKNLEIINMSNQDTPILYNKVPLLNIDLWEHAYYINYENDKKRYITNFKQIIDFNNANNIYNNI